MPETARILLAPIDNSLLGKWFKVRGTTAMTLNVISLVDFDRAKKL